jgi:hypothetical protein
VDDLVADGVGLAVSTIPGLPWVDGAGPGVPVHPPAARINAAVTTPTRTPDLLARPLPRSAPSPGCPLRSTMSRRYRIVPVRA